MIRKIIVAIIATYSLTALAFCNRDTLIEIKGSGFFPTSHLFRKIYHSSGMIGGELTVEGYCNWYGWLSIDYLRKSGLSINGLTKTRVNYLPIAFGLKYFNSFCYGDWYVGLGAVAGRIHTHDFSPFVAPFYTKWGWGGIAKLGCIIDFSCSWFIDLFVNYSFVKASSHNTNGGTVIPHTAKVDGAIVGIGVGYRF